MSRIGNQPITVPAKVTVKIDGKKVSVEGPKATLEHVLPESIDATLEGQQLVVSRNAETRQARSLHGLSRTLLDNMVTGVETGFKKELEIRGVGYRAQVQGQTLNLALGLSNPIDFPIPEGITVTVADNVRVTIEGADKQLVGQVAATIRGFRPPEVYKGKGVRYLGEYVIQKQGKTV